MAWKDPEKKREWHKKNDRQYCAEHRKERLERAKKWNTQHQEKHKERLRKYNREKIRRNGRIVPGLTKRKWTGYCELCRKKRTGRKPITLHYHHWDNKNPSKGIWVCAYPCHQICEAVDKGQIHLAERYLELKKSLDKEEEFNHLKDWFDEFMKNKKRFRRILITS